MPFGIGFFATAGAGGGGGAFELISTQVLGSNTASVTFSSIPSTYSHLQLRVVGRSGRTLENDTWGITFNGITSASYAYHRLRGSGSAVASIANTGMTIMDIGIFNTAVETASAFATSIVDILDYNSTAKNTTIRALTGKNDTGSFVSLNSGFLNNTAAITSLTVQSTQGFNLLATSRFSLYGVRG